jgi:hypothetical protein
MKAIFKSTQATLVGGILFLLPAVVVAIIGGRRRSSW